MSKFEVGRIYRYEHRIILEEVVNLYRCDRRTEKTVWMTSIKEDGTDGYTTRYRIKPWGTDDEYVAGKGFGNPRSCWYSSGVHLYSDKYNKEE